MKALGIQNMTVGEIEKILSIYPWFAFARKELLVKMSALGDEYRNDALRRTNLYIYPEKESFIQSYITSLESSQATQFVEPVYELDYFDSISIGSISENEGHSEENTSVVSPSPDIRVDSAVSEEHKEPQRQVYIVGGDYFSNSDFEGLSKDGMDSFAQLTTAEEAPEEAEKEEKKFVASEFNDEYYYTETLARIYAEQELYERAIEVYEKLILLYPEKSAYFATLKSEIKKHL